MSAWLQYLRKPKNNGVVLVFTNFVNKETQLGSQVGFCHYGYKQESDTS